MTRTHLVEDLTKERHGAKDIGFVDAGDAARWVPGSRTGSLLGELKGVANDSLGTCARDDHAVHSRLPSQLNTTIHRSEETFHVLTQQHEVDVPRTITLQRTVIGRVEIDRTQAGVQIEQESQVDLGPHFGTVRPAHIRKPHRTDQNCIRLPAGLYRRFGQGIARLLVAVGTGGVLTETQDRPPCGIENPQCFIDNIRANAVSFEHGDLVTRHRGLVSLQKFRWQSAEATVGALFGIVNAPIQVL